MHQLDGKVALVTGASSGIGLETARRFCELGATVVLAARRKAVLEDSAQELREKGYDVRAHECDVRSGKSVKALVSAVRDACGRLDILVAGAGLGYYLPIDETTVAAWCTTIETNLTGAYLCAAAAMPLLEESKGLIVFLGSTASEQGFANFTAYCASKAGLLGFARALREEIRPRGVRVSIVMPGATRTNFWNALAGKWDESQMMDARAVAVTIGNVAVQPGEITVEEVRILPSGGLLKPGGD